MRVAAWYAGRFGAARQGRRRAQAPGCEDSFNQEKWPMPSVVQHSAREKTGIITIDSPPVNVLSPRCGRVF